MCITRHIINNESVCHLACLHPNAPHPRIYVSCTHYNAILHPSTISYTFTSMSPPDRRALFWTSAEIIEARFAKASRLNKHENKHKYQYKYKYDQGDDAREEEMGFDLIRISGTSTGLAESRVVRLPKKRDININININESSAANAHTPPVQRLDSTVTCAESKSKSGWMRRISRMPSMSFAGYTYNNYSEEEEGRSRRRLPTVLGRFMDERKTQRRADECLSPWQCASLHIEDLEPSFPCDTDSEDSIILNKY